MYYHDYSIVLFCYNSFVTHVSSQCILYRSCPSGLTIYRGLFTMVLLSHTKGCVTHVLSQLPCYNGLVTAVLLQRMIAMVWSVTQLSSVVLSHQFCYTYCYNIITQYNSAAPAEMV